MRDTSFHPFLSVLLVVAVSLLTACGDDATGVIDDDDNEPPSPPPTLPGIASFEVVDTSESIFRSVLVELDSAGTLEVLYQPIDGGNTFRMTSDVPTTSHDVFLPRLLADTAYDLLIRSYDGATVLDSVRTTFTTAPLPAALATMEYTVEGTATFPLLVFNHNVPGEFQGVIVLQTDGHIVWYTTAGGTGGAATPIPGSHDVLFMSSSRRAIMRVSPRGDIVAQMPYDRVGAVHHDIATLDESRVAIIARDDSVVNDTIVSAEAIWIWDMETDDVAKVWTAWDYFDWHVDRTERSEPEDWLHANAVAQGPRGNLILSLHYLNQVVSIAPDYESLEWRLGGVNATIAVSPGDQFTGQHSAFELPGERVILFDNRYELADAPSRGLELQIDGDSAYVVWEYLADPPIRSQIWSGHYALPNGHHVVSFPVPAVVQPPGGAPPFTVDEVDANEQRVWRLTGPDLTPTFRGVPWTGIAGEELVDLDL